MESGLVPAFLAESKTMLIKPISSEGMSLLICSSDDSPVWHVSLFYIPCTEDRLRASRLTSQRGHGLREGRVGDGGEGEGEQRER